MPSKRVFVASVATETNSFSPLRSDLQDFKESFYAPPGMHPDSPTLCSAVFPVARGKAAEYGWTLIEGTATWAEPGGVINQKTWEFLRDQLLAELEAAMPLDVVFLGLHGAMLSQDCLDCEGELLEKVREIVGADAIVGATFDPHSHLSDRRVANADIVVAFKEFPHTDFVIAAEKLIDLAHNASRGLTKPVTSVFDCKMIEVLPSNRQPMRDFINKIKAIEQQDDDVLSISVIHGFMAGDTPELGSKMVVITNDHAEKGEALARSLGLELFDLRGKTRPEFLTPAEALDIAQASLDGPVVIADVWDNPGGGVAGDSTIILRYLLDHAIKDVALASIWDPIAVRTCISAGEGARLQLRFGGKMSANAGDPVDAEIVVRRIVRDAVQNFGSSTVPLGDSVCITVQGIDVILNTVRSQVFGTNVFTNLGINPCSKKILIVKSTNHFYDAFAKIASDILYAAIDGPYPNDPVTNNYKHLKREIWPMVAYPHRQV